MQEMSIIFVILVLSALKEKDTRKSTTEEKEDIRIFILIIN